VNKPGYTTSEFWSTLLGQLVALVVIVRPSVIIGTNLAPLVQAFAVLAAAVASAAYSHSRGRVKVAAGSAVVVAPGPASGLHTEPLVQRDAA
jgi:flagellar motor component MotA